MSLDLGDPELAPHLARLEPYARRLLEIAGSHALRLHAETLTPEHLLWTLMEDPCTAAHAAVLHAFADPATISEEALAISPGLMVVASGSTLPFSARAAVALARARAAVEACGGAEVGVSELLAQAAAVLDEDMLRTLRAAGFLAGEAILVEGSAEPLRAGLFKHFATPAKRALSAANRLAAGERMPSISHVHLLLACLKEDEELALRIGLSFHRARLLLSGRTRDDSSAPSRTLRPDRSMIAFLAGLPARSDSLALLARFLDGGTPELGQILVRSKVTGTLLERARGAFRDPQAMEDRGPSRRSEGVEL